MRRLKIKRQIDSKKSRVVLGIKIPVIFFPVIAVFVAFSIYATIQLLVSGAKLADLRRRSSSLAKENEELRVALVSTTSLTELDKVSTDMGFSKPANILYIEGEETVAKLP